MTRGEIYAAVFGWQGAVIFRFACDLVNDHRDRRKLAKTRTAKETAA